MFLLRDNPRALKASLRAWISAVVRGAPQDMRVSTRRLDNMIYSRRAIKLSEFAALMGAESFAQALCDLIGAQVGSVMAEQRQRV